MRHARTLPVTQAIEVGTIKGSREKRQVSFSSRVSCIHFRDLTVLPQERKAEIWWQPQDFDAFLSIRVEIGKAYRAAAKQLGLDIMQVSSIGSHGDEGYRAMININSKLCGESRRGLGLGRKRQRAKNRDAYIAAVLEEQSRQLKHAGGALEESDGSHTSASVKLDAKKIAEKARKVSEKDRLYAHWIAESYFRQDREVERNAIREAELRAAEAQAQAPQAADRSSDEEGEKFNRRTSSAPSEALLLRIESPAPALPDRVDSDLALVGKSDFPCLNDEDPGNVKDKNTPLSNTSLSAKGFGLSLDRLREVGLTANGHSISRYQSLRKCGRQTPALGEETESDGTACETEVEPDDICLDDDSSVAIVTEYRQWRMGAPVRAGLPGFSEVKTYGTRKEYRAWRAWQKQPGSPTEQP